jgi:predicted DNA-binding protein (UPF0251 family)
MSKRKIKERTYEEKMEIIRYVDDHKSMKKKDIASHFEICPSTLIGILKNREKITSACATEDVRMGATKRIRSVNNPDVGKAMLIWFRQKSALPDVRLDGTMPSFRQINFVCRLIPRTELKLRHLG